MINRTPRGYEAGIALKAGTAAALITDYERKAVAGRIPYLDLLDGSNDATELHDAPRITAPRHQGIELRRLFDGDPAQLRRISDRPHVRRARPAVLADLLDIFDHRVNRRHDAAHHRRFVEESVRAARGVPAKKTKTSFSVISHNNSLHLCYGRNRARRMSLATTRSPARTLSSNPCRIGSGASASATRAAQFNRLVMSRRSPYARATLACNAALTGSRP